MIKYVVIFAVVLAIALIAGWMGSRTQNGISDAGYATKDASIRDILALDEGIEDVLASHGLHCVGCPSAVSETLEQACTVHNLEPDEVLSAVNDYLKRKEAANGD